MLRYNFNCFDLALIELYVFALRIGSLWPALTRRELPDEKLQVHFAGHAGDDTSDCRGIHCGYEGQKSSFCKRCLKIFCCRISKS